MVGSAAGPVVMAVAVHAGGLGLGWCVTGGAIAAAGILVAPRRTGDRSHHLCTDGALVNLLTVYAT